MKLTQQEKLVIDFLSNKEVVFWEELAQFCKNPLTVKLRTVQKIVSDIKKKHKENNIDIPFNCSFKVILDQKEEKFIVNNNSMSEFNGQKLVQIKRKNNNIVSSPIKMGMPKIELPSDFIVKNHQRQVITKSGIYNLNEDDFFVFEYLFNNKHKFISLEELRDKVCFKNYGSKLPPRWFSSIQRRVGNIRNHIPELKNRILTAKQNNIHGYIFSL